MKTAVIIGRKNGAGLDQDAALIARALADWGWVTRHYGPREVRGFFRRDRADLVIHLERFFPWWKAKARNHVLIPNQERFPARHLSRLAGIDQIWCKTKHARDIFSKHHASVRLIGFTSPDRLMPEVKPNYGSFFHLAGRSTVKGTDVLLGLWACHPEWPLLTLVQHPDNAPAVVPANVRLLDRRVDDAELKSLQNACGVHLCPSLSEGWGHYIVEAMSCRAIVITTDGPPMNELVAHDRGLLVTWDHSEPRHLGVNYHVDKSALERAISSLIVCSVGQKQALGHAARLWFEQTAPSFRNSLGACLVDFKK